MIKMYVRDKSRKPIGCVVAIQGKKNKVAIGTSKCNDVDIFDKDIATELAIGRAAQKLLGMDVTNPAHTCNKVVDIVRSRASTYFKGCEVIN